jgi:hypothetical protein
LDTRPAGSVELPGLVTKPSLSDALPVKRDIIKGSGNDGKAGVYAGGDVSLPD